MAYNRGKSFEEKFKNDFLKIEGATIDRLYDVVTGYKHISQVCDFIGYIYPNIFYLECKSHKKSSMPISNITQYAELKNKVGIPGVRTGVVIWFMDKDVVIYVPTAEITKMIADGEKSIGIRMLDSNYKNKYNIKIIPSVKKIVYMDSDYSILKTLKEGE